MTAATRAMAAPSGLRIRLRSADSARGCGFGSGPRTGSGPRIRGRAGSWSREPGPDLITMLVEPGRGKVIAWRTARERQRMADAGPGGIAVARDYHRLQADLGGERDPLLDGVDRPAGHPGRAQLTEPFSGRAPGELLHQH